MNLESFYGIMIFIFGLVLGSFYNVVGYRLPNNMSIVYPDSHCPKCNHKLKWYELIPVLSYLFQRGKCVKCKEGISIFYPLFELITGILFLISYLVFGINIKFFISITFVSILVIITISDLKYYIIPDEVLIVGSLFIIIELIINFIIKDTSFVKEVLYPVLNGVLSFIFLYIFKLIADFLFKKESLGGGDIKLMFVIGLVIGFDMGVVTLFLAAFLALPISIISLIKNNENVLPFGPYLSLAALILLFTKIDLNMILSFFTR